MERHNETDDGSSIDVAGAKAHEAVALLANMTGPDTYRERDVAEAIDHIHAAREAAPAGTDTAERVDAALDHLNETANPVRSTDEKKLYVHDALGELAPVAAGITDRDPEGEGAERRSESEKPAAPVFYSVPPAAVDRAIERFEHRRAEGPAREPGSHLQDFIYDEVDQQSVIYVGGEPLAEYAAGRVDELVIEPDDDPVLDDD